MVQSLSHYVLILTPDWLKVNLERLVTCHRTQFKFFIGKHNPLDNFAKMLVIGLPPFTNLGRSFIE